MLGCVRGWTGEGLGGGGLPKVEGWFLWRWWLCRQLDGLVGLFPENDANHDFQVFSLCAGIVDLWLCLLSEAP